MSEHPGKQHHESPKQIERRRKTFNDYGMLMGTLIAALATLLAWNEARLTRQDARAEAEKAIQIQRDALNAQIKQFNDSTLSQQKSFIEQQAEATRSYLLQKQALDAQVAAIQLDERPFVTISESQWIHQNIFPAETYLKVNLNASGKTPALKLELRVSCYAGRDFKHEKPIRNYATVLTLHLLGNTSLSNIHLCQIPSQTIYTENLRGPLLATGSVNYEDLHHKNHSTTFCLVENYLIMDPKEAKERYIVPSVPCKDFIPEIT